MHEIQSNPVDDASPEFCAGRKVTETHKALLWQLLNDDPACPSRLVLHTIAETQGQIAVTLRQINRLRKAWGLNHGKGRPRRASAQKKAEPQGHLLQVIPRLSCVGVHLFAHWLDQHETFRPVVAQLTQAVEAHHHTHPDEDFALLHHRESTLLRRFQALFFAPLFGIDRLTAFDTQEHPLATLLGRGYHHSTLSQFLGQLERVDAAEVLLPALVPAQTGSNSQEQIPRSSLRFAMHLRSENFEGSDVQGKGAFVSPRSTLRGRAFTYVDGHMIAYWSRMSMHKGKITMLGRIMAGSQAVIAHDDAGQALFVAYYPPDIHVSQVIVAYCQRVALATGRSMFVIDRAVNSVALAQAFDAQGLGLLCMLDDNEYAGVESFEAASVETREDGTRVYSGSWKEARADDPRHFVIVQAAEGKTLVYWGTPQVQDALEAKEWPGVYRERNEIQEHRFKDMIDHGALNINYGRKKMLGADRHHQRKQAQLDQSLETAHKRVDKKAAALKAQQDKVAESVSNGHGKRLEQRRRTLLTLEHECTEAKMTQAKCAKHVATLGPAGQRADRDFRKQTIMTIRTLFLENCLRTFIGALSALLFTKVSLPQVLSLLFERSGSRIETPSQVLYWVNSAGLSLSNRRLLSEVAQGLCAMGLQEQGKSVHVRLKDLPP